MKFRYSSMYVREDIESIEELVKILNPSIIQLQLDANICIYLREFYRTPSKTIVDEVLWHELKAFFMYIEQYNVAIDYSLGVEESCRNLNDFKINYEKLDETIDILRDLFKMDFLQKIEHSKLIRFSEPVKDKSKRKSSKAESLEQESSFQNLIILSYACLLKLYLIYNDEIESSNVKKMINYMDFLSNEINIISGTHIIYGNLLLSGHPKAARLIHSNKKTIPHFIHGIWNAALDLTLPTLVSRKFSSAKKVPVFVTRDELLWLIFDSMKMKYVFSAGENFVHPPFIEIDFSKCNWTMDEIEQINKHYSKIQEKRLYNFMIQNESVEERLDKLRGLCLVLENDVKEFLSTKKGWK
ncbi:hypothetical protein MN093_14435 [Bacillus mycoides]|uniref:hypothetical protein n=1 Tax=Bacillus mycoides TaxID=1405 RepID=UPI00187986CA|nr:hypothetical protein [Bacillus mycoides]MBE7148919.1 hypothetical protein [Bacillus mycoides]UNJ91729.1 hypothetical protein MN093_14435 [Bacillus mycoides]